MVTAHGLNSKWRTKSAVQQQNSHDLNFYKTGPKGSLFNMFLK